MNKPFQRKGATSNTQVGHDFEEKAKVFFSKQGLELKRNIAVDIGINGKKTHVFDLGEPTKKIIVECKSHKWTEGGNVPSAKMTTWNQAMYFFHAAPSIYRKIFFVLRDFSEKKNETLADYYIRTNPHLIPSNVEFWEYDEQEGVAERKR
jgi:hypothetical protein